MKRPFAASLSWWSYACLDSIGGAMVAAIVEMGAEVFCCDVLGGGSTAGG
jgi:hypothetical protein